MTQPPQAAIDAARASMATWKIPASVSLAQWALESGWGTRMSGKFNYGGITAKVKDAVFPFVPGTPLEPATLCATHENWQGKRVACKRWFKDFPSLGAYFAAHAKLLATGTPYVKARTKLPDPFAFANALTGVYATDPNYGATLGSIMRGSGLTRFDK